MSDETKRSQSGGVNNSGTMNTGGGDIVGRDKIVTGASAADVAALFQPMRAAIGAAPPEAKAAASEKLDALEMEAAKGDSADDDTVADLVDGIVDLVPTAAGVVVSSFADPTLAGIAGAATKFVLRKLRGK